MTFPRTTKISVPFVYKGKDLGVVAEVVSYKNEYMKGHKDLNHKVVMPCGQHEHYYNGGGDLDADSKQSIMDATKQHVRTCRACWVALGTSKADVMTQDEVAALFSRGIDGKRSSTRNLESERGVLEHYSTMEAIRLGDGTVIDNSECFARGFASCPHVPNAAFAMPLTTIYRGVGSWSYRDFVNRLTIIEHDKASGATLFTWKPFNETQPTRSYLCGYDEGRAFVNELFGQPKSVKEALESMKPLMVKSFEEQGGVALRQGDLWFIPMDHFSDKDVVMQVGARIEKQAILVDVNGNNWNGGINHALPHDARAFDSEFYTGDVREGQKSAHSAAPIPVIHQVKEWARNTITHPRQNLLGTRHVATRAGVVKHYFRGTNVLVAKGFVRHAGQDHRRLELGETWHIVCQTVARSFGRQSARRGD